MPDWSRIVGVKSKSGENADVYLRVTADGMIGGVVILSADVYKRQSGCGIATSLSYVVFRSVHGGSSLTRTTKITNGRIISAIAISKPSRSANCTL